MALSAVRRITEVAHEVWPEVQRAIDMNMRSIRELAGVAEEVDGEVEDYFAKAKGGAKRKAIVNETVWILQRMGLLRSGNEAELIRAAYKVVEQLREELSEDQMTPEERRFVELVDELPDWKESAA